MTQNGKFPVNVPILGQGLHRYRCKAGHVYEAPQPWRIVLPGAVSGPCCPMCVMDYLAFMFPQWPEGMTMQMAVEQKILNADVLEVTDG